MSKIKTFYNKRIWLNDENCPSTGSMVAYDGLEIIDSKSYINQYLKISDCYHIIKLHRAKYDTEKDFLNKLILMRNELNLYIEHLQNKMNNE